MDNSPNQRKKKGPFTFGLTTLIRTVTAKEDYQFGDFTRSIIPPPNPERDSYQFGDFTRSLIHSSPTRDYKNVPGPQPSLFVENLPDILPDFWEASSRLCKEYGHLFKLRILGRRIYICSDPEALLIIMKQQEKLLPKQELASEGIFLADGETWSFARRVLQDFFTGRAIDSYMSMYHRLGNEFLDFVQAEQKSQGFVKLVTLSEKSMLNAICEVGLGIVGNDELKHRFGKTFEYLLNAQIKRQTRLSIFNTVPSRENHKFHVKLRKLDQILDEIISNPMTPERNDILARMLRAEEPGTGRKFSVTEIKHQLVTLLVAGHKTSSLLLAWSIFCISQDPSVEQKIKKELKSALKLDGTRLVFPSFDDLKKLTYMDMVLKETMRLHPPAQSAVRGIGDEKLKVGDYRLKRGNVFISIYETHRNSQYWEDPERFDPQRFTPENMAKMHKGQFIPFGGFERTCIGNLFALTEVKVNLCLIYQSFHPRASALHPIVGSFDPLFPSSDLPLIFVRRDTLLGSTSKEEKIVEHVKARYVPDPNDAQKNESLVEFFHKSAGQLFVLYGSNTGTSKEFASQLGRKADEFKLKPVVMSLDEYYEVYLSKGEKNEYHTALIITSTWNGNPPDNAKKFANWLNDPNLDGQRASHFNFAVFGVGNSHWNMTYLAFPKLAERKLIELGGNELIDFRHGDESKDLQMKFEELHDVLWYFFAYELKLLPNVDPSSLNKPALSNFEVEILPSTDLDLEEEEVSPSSTFYVEEVRELQTGGSNRSTKHVALKIPRDCKYETGDHLEVSAENPPQSVERLCKLLGYSPNTFVTVKTNMGSSVQLPGWAANGATSLGKILRKYVDINGIVTRPVIQILAENALDQSERLNLESLGGKTQQSFDLYNKEILQKGVTVVELLEFHPSVKISLGGLLGVLPTLKKRSYSISSSPLHKDGILTLSVGQVSFTTLTGRNHFGTASTYLGGLREGNRLICNVNPSPMRYPSHDLSAPIICVCNGTGLAPFRGFLQERLSQNSQQKLGEFHLFFGCRSENEDFIYKEELLAYEKSGLCNLHLAFSRDQGRKVYVQDKMKENQKLIADVMISQKGYFFVCGDARTMAKDVQAELCNILQHNLPTTEDGAREKFIELVGSGRVVLDVWGGNHN